MAKKYVIVCGGVISGVGKGIVSASLGKILQEYGMTVSPVKIDPYINLDAGTMRPTEHGEVWVTDDGGEIDQDLGNYERFLDIDISKTHNITTGQVYKAIIERERSGGYLGKDVKFIPHVPEEINRRIKEATRDVDVGIVEIGGTVGDFENIPFLFAAKALETELGRENVAHVLVTYLPIPNNLGEPKTKPTQQAVKHLTECGIIPDFIFCRSHKTIDKIRRKKIETYANIKSNNVIASPDVTSIYSIPLHFEEEGVGQKIMERLSITPKQSPQWGEWRKLLESADEKSEPLQIAIIGKYIDSGDFTLEDSYISVKQSILHACHLAGVRARIVWIDAKEFETNPESIAVLDNVDAVIVPGGFGVSGIEGKISSIEYCRKKGIPFLGLCYGLQLAVVEFARNVLGMKNAHTTEANEQAADPIITILESQKKVVEQQRMGASMRLGAYAATILPGTKVHELYSEAGRIAKDSIRIKKLKQSEEKTRLGTLQENTAEIPIILERHRHRYEVNPDYVNKLQEGGLTISGVHRLESGTNLVEFIELKDHPYFVATQSHPEFKSRPLDPAPLFIGLIRAAAKRKTSGNIAREKVSEHMSVRYSKQHN